MPFDPYLAGKLHLMENLDFHQMDADMTSRMTAFYEDPEAWSMPAGVSVEDAQLDGPNGGVPYRVYRPETANGRVLVWAHGGGFATGDLDSPEAHIVAAELAHRSGVVVVSVDYRLARDGIHYPVPIDDVHAVVASVLAGTADGVGASNWVGVGGASAGAALAMAATHRFRDIAGPSPDALLLAYPFVHFPTPGLSPEAAAELAILPPALRTPPGNIEWIIRNYVGRVTDLPVDVAPGAAPLDQLPATHIVISEYDDLRSSAELLITQLTEVGVPVHSYVAAGMPHGHLNRSPSLAEVDRSLDFFAGALHD